MKKTTKAERRLAIENAKYAAIAAKGYPVPTAA